MRRFEPRSYAALVNVGVVIADLLFVGLALLVTRQTLELRHAAARTDAQNLARLLETGLTSSFDRIDQCLQTVADEHRRIGAGVINGSDFEGLLARQKERTPDLLSLRVLGPEGATRAGSPLIDDPVSLADQDFFVALRDHPELELVVSRPVTGRIMRTPLLGFSRRLSGPDGSFQGVVTGTVALARLEELLSQVDVGKHGVISLRWQDLSLVAQRGVLGGAPVPVGDRRISPELEAIGAGQRTEATYRARAVYDGTWRTWSFRKVGRFPLFLNVGLAQNDYLAQWQRQTVVVWLLVAGVVALSVVAALYGRTAWRRRIRYERLLLERTERLRESEERFRTAFSTSPDPIGLTRLADGTMLMVNEGFTRMTGYREDEVLGRTSVELGLWEDPADREELAAALRRDGRVVNLEMRLRDRQGRTQRGLISARRIEMGGEALILILIRDITAWKAAEAERDRLQLEVQQAQRLEGIGRLAGGVAHDFNNLLTVILAAVEALRGEAKALGPRAREDLEQVEAAAERARDLTRQLLAFARKQVIAPIPLDLAQAVRASGKLLRRMLGEDVVLQLQLERDLWPVLADPAQLEQVIFNLAVNARDAMPGGGRLEISACNAEVRLPAEAGEGDRAAGQWVRLRVKDSGSGMTPEVRAHLFEPFFTTKGPGRGTGLGLATVHGIVAQSGGHIEVETEPGQGTLFDVYLPRAEGEPATARVAAPRPSTRTGSETLLLVEDDAMVRGVIVRVLTEAGYEVLVAEGGDAALELAARFAGPLHLVVTDVIMPGLSGPQVVRQLERLRPGLRALYVSGYTADAIAERGVLESGIEFLPKPFTAGALLERVRTLLDGREADPGLRPVATARP
jgi:PAS domain S-box-containing protein